MIPLTEDNIYALYRTTFLNSNTDGNVYELHHFSRLISTSVKINVQENARVKKCFSFFNLCKSNIHAMDRLGERNDETYHGPSLLFSVDCCALCISAACFKITSFHSNVISGITVFVNTVISVIFRYYELPRK